MEFEWDENKNLSNIKKHGYDFRQVLPLMVRTPSLFVYESSYQGEQRYVAIAPFDGSYVAIIYTKRQEKIRIISVRRARKKEVKSYEQEKRKDS